MMLMPARPPWDLDAAISSRTASYVPTFLPRRFETTRSMAALETTPSPPSRATAPARG